MNNPTEITVWEGDWGTYEVPERFAGPLRIRVDGWPDKRQKALYAEFMVWVNLKETQAALPHLLSKTDASGASHG